MKRVPTYALLLILACSREPAQTVTKISEVPPPSPDPYTLDAAVNFVNGIPALAENGSVNMVVEIPAGTIDKWEVEEDGVMRWEFRNDKPRVVQYLGYPGNYGLVPRTLLPYELGGDGDPVDVIALGPAAERGAVLEVRLLGVLKLQDGGEWDDKLLAVTEESPLAAAVDVETLEELFPGVTSIVETWFGNYKGPGEIESGGFAGPDEAWKVLEAAITAYEATETENQEAAAAIN
jgi:inorganic pyrophosphatase